MGLRRLKPYYIQSVLSHHFVPRRSVSAHYHQPTTMSTTTTIHTDTFFVTTLKALPTVRHILRIDNSKSDIKAMFARAQPCPTSSPSSLSSCLLHCYGSDFRNVRVSTCSTLDIPMHLSCYGTHGRLCKLLCVLLHRPILLLEHQRSSTSCVILGRGSNPALDLDPVCHLQDRVSTTVHVKSGMFLIQFEQAAGWMGTSQQGFFCLLFALHVCRLSCVYPSGLGLNLTLQYRKALS